MRPKLDKIQVHGNTFLIFFSGYNGRECIPKLSEEYMAGKIKLDEFITHTMPLDKINEAFDLMRAGKRFVEFSEVTPTALRVPVSNFIHQYSLSELLGNLRQ